MNTMEALSVLRQVTDRTPLVRADHQKVEEAYATLFDAVKPKPATDGQEPKAP